MLHELALNCLEQLLSHRESQLTVALGLLPPAAALQLHFTHKR